MLFPSLSVLHNSSLHHRPMIALTNVRRAHDAHCVISGHVHVWSLNMCAKVRFLPATLTQSRVTRPLLPGGKAVWLHKTNSHIIYNIRDIQLLLDSLFHDFGDNNTQMIHYPMLVFGKDCPALFSLHSRTANMIFSPLTTHNKQITHLARTNMKHNTCTCTWTCTV